LAQELDTLWLLTHDEIAFCMSAYSSSRLAVALQPQRRDAACVLEVSVSHPFNEDRELQRDSKRVS